jgi:hypothetical protein
MAVIVKFIERVYMNLIMFWKRKNAEKISMYIIKGIISIKKIVIMIAGASFNDISA